MGVKLGGCGRRENTISKIKLNGKISFLKKSNGIIKLMIINNNFISFKNFQLKITFKSILNNLPFCS